jgi:hypothetical protein
MLPQEPGIARVKWLADLYASGVWPFGVEVLERKRTFKTACEAEAKWIAKGRKLGWPLTNRYKSGGGGVPIAVRAARREEWMADRTECCPTCCGSGTIPRQDVPLLSGAEVAQ